MISYAETYKTYEKSSTSDIEILYNSNSLLSDKKNMILVTNTNDKQQRKIHVTDVNKYKGIYLNTSRERL